MSAYLPTDATTLALTAVLLLAILLLGYCLTWIRNPRVGRMAAWALAVVGVMAAERLTADQMAGFRMLAIIFALLFAMKVVVTIESLLSGSRRLSFPVWIGFATLWFGMRPDRPLLTRPDQATDLTRTPND